jgi:transposase
MPSWFFTSLRGYRIAWLPRDLVAGLMLLAIALPGQLATARLAGMPPETGIYAFVAGSLAFANASRIVLMDKAGWHTSGDLVVPESLSLVLLPPYSPELNPIERLWLHLRDNRLSHCVFQTTDEIVDSCCDAWNWCSAKPGGFNPCAPIPSSSGSATSQVGISYRSQLLLPLRADPCGSATPENRPDVYDPKTSP